MRVVARTVVSAVAVTAAFAVSSHADAHESTVNVGVLAALSGPAAPFGIPERNVVKALAKRLNAEGGVNGHRVHLYYYNEHTDPTDAARGTLKLIRQDHVSVILGPSTGSSVLAMAPIAAKAHVPVLAPDATQSITAPHQKFLPYMFRTCPDSRITIQKLLKEEVFSKPKINRVAIMYQQDAYGKEEEQLAKEMLEKHKGITITAIASAPLTATDVTAQASKIVKSKPDIVLLLTSAPQVGGTFVRDARRSGLKVRIAGSLSLQQAGFIKTAGKYGNGVTSMTIGNLDDPGPKQKKLDKIIRSDGMKPSGYPDIIGSAGFSVLKGALAEINGKVTGAKIRDKLAQMCNYTKTYAKGPICYRNNDHNAFDGRVLQLEQLDNGKWKNLSS